MIPSAPLRPHVRLWLHRLRRWYRSRSRLTLPHHHSKLRFFCLIAHARQGRCAEEDGDRTHFINPRTLHPSR